jgi:apolipoprotein N-acyltransferase
VRHRSLTLLGGVGAGLCICAALPPWGWWPLAPVGLAWWLQLLGGRGPRGRALAGLGVGLGWFAPSTVWIWALTAPGYVVAILVWGAMVAATSALAPGDDRRLVVLPALLVLLQWVHWHAPFGGVPLSVLAMTQAGGPLVTVARLGGSLLLGAAVGALGSALWLAANRRWVPATAVAAAVVAVALAGAAWPSGRVVARERIVAIQGGGPQGTRFSSAEAPLVYRRHLETTRTVEGPVDLVVWPENTLNVSGRFEDSVERDELAAEAARLGADIVVGVVEDVDAERFANYVVVVRPDGTLGDRYDKERRVPFGEYVPLRPLIEPLAGDTLPARDQVPGTGTSMVRTSGGPMAVAISWEVFFGRRVREGVRAGGEMVLNPTNGSSYWLTLVQSQQVAASRLRAVESGRWLVQAAPTGYSAFVVPAGGGHQRTSVSERAVLRRTVPRLTGTTPAQALGDLPALALAAAALVGAVVLGRRNRGDRPSDLDEEGDGAVVHQ